MARRHLVVLFGIHEQHLLAAQSHCSQQRHQFDAQAGQDGRRFVEELQNGGRTIPTIIFPDGSHLLEPADEDLARKLGLKLEASRPFYDLAVVGGWPAGLAAAIYAAREGIDSVVIDRSAMGRQAGVTERIDNYLGFPDGVGGAELADRFVAQVVERNPELKASRLLQDKVLTHPQFTVHTNTEVLELRGKRRLEEVVAHDRSTGAEMRWHPAAAFIFIGLTLNTEFVRGSVDVDEWSFVRTDGAFQTSTAGVFAAGDVTAGSTKQLGSAVGDGIAALLQVRRYLEQHHQKAELAVNA